MHPKTVAAMSSLVLLLGACAQTDTTPSKAQDNQAPANAAVRQEVAAAPVAMPTPAEPKSGNAEHGFTDHTVIEFDGKSRELGGGARESIALLGGSAQHARQIVITGYCDRRSAANAKEIALFRAIAVKNELVSLGASEKNIRVKYVTVQAKQEVTIDLTER